MSLGYPTVAGNFPVGQREDRLTERCPPRPATGSRRGEFSSERPRTLAHVYNFKAVGSALVGELTEVDETPRRGAASGEEHQVATDFEVTEAEMQMITCIREQAGSDEFRLLIKRRDRAWEIEMSVAPNLQNRMRGVGFTFDQAWNNASPGRA